MKTYRIPFNRPSFVGREREYFDQAVQNRSIAGDGAFSKKCQSFFENEFKIPKALLTPSCTQALEMAAILIDIKAGDEVIVPSFTFVATVNAFVLRGAHPVFIDIRPDTLNLDEARLEELITPRTKAVVPVHYGGVACEMDQILKIARRHRLVTIEDNAHGLFGKYKGRFLGTLGDMGTLSFHETKNFTCGEGGALMINDPRYVERALIIRNKGTNRDRFLRGEIDQYTWIDIGSSYLPSDITAAILYAQLEAREKIQAKRRRLWHYYFDHLRDWAVEFNVQLPLVPNHCEQSYHLFYLVMPAREQRDALIKHLHSRGIQSVFHYVPLHLSVMTERFGWKRGECPNTESIANRLLRLPFYYELTESDQAEVVSEVMRFSRAPAVLKKND